MNIKVLKQFSTSQRQNKLEHINLLLNYFRQDDVLLGYTGRMKRFDRSLARIYPIYQLHFLGYGQSSQLTMMA